MSSLRWLRVQQDCTTASWADSSSPGSAADECASAADERSANEAPADADERFKSEDESDDVEDEENLSRIVFFSFSGATKRVCARATTSVPNRTTHARTPPHAHAPEIATWVASG